MIFDNLCLDVDDCSGLDFYDDFVFIVYSDTVVSKCVCNMYFNKLTYLLI